MIATGNSDFKNIDKVRDTGHFRRERAGGKEVIVGQVGKGDDDGERREGEEQLYFGQEHFAANVGRKKQGAKKSPTRRVARGGVSSVSGLMNASGYRPT